MLGTSEFVRAKAVESGMRMSYILDMKEKIWIQS